MDNIGGETEEDSRTIMRTIKEDYLFSYCKNLLKQNVCNIWIHSALTFWEAVQIISYFINIHATKSDSFLQKLETGITFSTDPSKPLGMIIFFAVIGLLTLLFIGIFMQKFLATAEHKCQGKIASIYLKFLSICIILVSGCFASIFGAFLLLPFNCSKSIKAGLSTNQCWEYSHIIYAVCGALFIVVLLLILLIYSLFLQDEFFHSKHMYAGILVSYKIIGVLYKILISIDLVFDMSESAQIAISGLLMLALILRLYIILTGPAMWDARFTYIFIGSDSILATFALSGFIRQIFDLEIGDSELIIIFIMAFTVGITMVLFKKRMNDGFSSLGINDVKNSNSALQHLNSLIKLYLGMKRSEESKNKLLGALISHQELCEDDECKCQDVILNKASKKYSQSNLISGDKVLRLENDSMNIQSNKQNAMLPEKQESEEGALQQQKINTVDPYVFIIHELILGAKRRYPRNIGLTLLESYFTNGILENSYKAVYELVVAKSLRPSFIESFAIYRYQSLIEEGILLSSSRAANALGEMGITVESAIRMEQLYNSFRNFLFESSKDIFKFLEIISNRQKFNSERIESLAEFIGIKANTLATKFDEFTREYPNHYQSMFEYAEFLEFVMNCELEANQIASKAQTVRGIIREKGQAATETHLLDLSRNENVAVLIVSANAGHLGTILNANDAVLANFGYEPKDVIDQHLNILLPYYFHDSHTELIHRLLKFGNTAYESGENSAGNKMVGICRDSKGYLHHFNLLFQLYPSLSKGLLFAVFAKKMEKYSVLLQTKSEITEQDVGIITCNGQGFVLGISEHLTKYFGVPMSLISGHNKKWTSTEKTRLMVSDLIPDFDLNDQDALNGRKILNITGKGIEKLIEVESFTSEQLNAMYDKFQYTLPIYVYCRTRNFAGNTIYELIFTKSDEDQWEQRGLQQEKVKQTGFDEALKYEVMSVTTSSSNDSVRKYMPLIKDIKDGVKSSNSYKIKLLQRVATLLCIILLGLNTTVMILTLNNISTSVSRVETIDNAWSRVVALSNIHLYLKTLVNIAKDAGNPYIHSNVDPSQPHDRFDKIKKDLITNVENLRILQNSLGKKDISFSSELNKFSEAQALQVDKLDSQGRQITEKKSSSGSFAELIGYIIEFIPMSEQEFNQTIRDPNYSSFFDTEVTSQEGAYYYVLHNTLEDYRTFSTEFCDALQSASIKESGKQMTTIIIFCTISLLFILCSGLLLSFIINKIKYTKLVVLAFYTEIPSKVIDYMSERTERFLKNLNTSKRMNASKKGFNSRFDLRLNEDHEENEVDCKNHLGSTHKLGGTVMDKNQVAINDYSNEKPNPNIPGQFKEIQKPLPEKLGEKEEKKDENEAIIDSGKLEEVVKTHFESTIRGHRLAIVFLLIMFEILFGGYTVSSIIFYNQSASASENSFNYLAIYLGTHASMTYHMAIFTKFISTKGLPSSRDIPDLLLYSINKMKGLNKKYMELKQKGAGSALIGNVVKAQNYIDSPTGLCELYEKQGGNIKLCMTDFNGLLQHGFNQLIFHILSIISREYTNFKYLGPERFDFDKVVAKFSELIRSKEEYMNLARAYVREALSHDLPVYFVNLREIVIIIYVVWLSAMIIIYAVSMKYLVTSLKKDVIQSNGILNMLPIDYLCSIAKNNDGRNFLQNIFL